ncbi:MAG: nucleoside triphosphate pyrophosphohydrolase [Myxococcota bacterium]
MEKEEFQRLIDVVDRLLSKDGCSWDRAQTLSSLRGFVLEEALELIDALDRRKIEDIEEELGDILYHIILISRLTERRDSLKRIIRGITEKLIKRHPHIFKNKKDKKPDEVVRDWEKIKIKEKNVKSIGYGLCSTFPALLSAFKLGVRSMSYNFDWDDIEQVFEKLEEEIGELKAELRRRRKNQKAIEYEVGDILFVVANIAKHLNVNPEVALMKTNKKFIRRFDEMCRLMKKEKRDIHHLEIDELESYWRRAKQISD